MVQLLTFAAGMAAGYLLFAILSVAKRDDECDSCFWERMQECRRCTRGAEEAKAELEDGTLWHWGLGK